jgi:hypothetical protein
VVSKATPRRTLALVVGDDAQKILKLLKFVADVGPDSMLLVADDEDKSAVNAHQVRTAFQYFVKRLKTGCCGHL